MSFLINQWKQKRWLRVLARTFLALSTLSCLAVLSLNWYGARVLRHVKVQAELAGIPIAFRDTLPDSIPASANFCAIPALDGITEEIDANPEKGAPGVRHLDLRALTISDEKHKHGPRPPMHLGYTLGIRTDMAALSNYFQKLAPLETTPPEGENPAVTIMRILSRQDALIENLGHGLTRPDAQWTPAWKTRELPSNLFTVPLPHLVTITPVSQALALRTMVAATAGESVKAHQAALITTRLLRASTNDPLVIGQLVAATQGVITVQSTWVLCDTQAGNANQFAILRDELTKIDFGKSASMAWNSEMAAMLQFFDMFKNDPKERVAYFSGPLSKMEESPVLRFLTRFGPEGWNDLTVVTACQLNLKYFIQPFRNNEWRRAANGVAELKNALFEANANPLSHPLLAANYRSFSMFANIAERTIYAQSCINQAIVACALESHFAEHHSYPNTLVELELAEGSSLPQDILTGKPMGYRRTPGGRYLLWCVGFDGVNNDGVRGVNVNNLATNPLYSLSYKGDWVWSYPAN